MPTAGRKSLQPGEKVLGYEIEKQIGVGGFGIVYKAKHPSFNETVAVKEYFPQGMDSTRHGNSIEVDPDNKELYDRFLDKFEETTVNLRSLDHPNIVKVHNFERRNGTGYMVMDYVEGTTLEDWAKSKNPPTDEQFRAVMKSVMHALDYLHSMQMFHRDISPMNIMIQEDGSPVIIDFGALKQTLTSGDSFTTIVPMNPRYAPPEQAANDPSLPVDAHTDVFAVAATMYRVVCNRYPEKAEKRVRDIALNKWDPLERALGSQKMNFSPQELTAIDHAMSLNARDRFPTIADFADALGWQIEGLRRPPNHTGVFEQKEETIEPTIPSNAAVEPTVASAAVVADKPDITQGSPNNDNVADIKGNEPGTLKRYVPHIAVALVTFSVVAVMAAFDGIVPNPFGGGNTDTTVEEPSNTEDENWRLARNSRSPDRINDFLSNHPNSRHADQAQALLDELQAEENYDAIRLSNSPSELLAFLEKFPDSPQAGLAKARLDTLRSESEEKEQTVNAPAVRPAPVPEPADRESNTEDVNWLLARNSRSPERINEFLSTHPDSRHAEQAQALLAELEAEENWDPIRFSDSQAELAAFVQKFPNTPQAKSAQIRLNKLRAEAEKDEQTASAPAVEPAPKPTDLSDNTEDENWRLVRNSRSQARIRDFLGAYPNTRHAKQALLLLAELEAEEKYDAIRFTDSQSELVAFLQKFPNTPQARVAQIRLNRLRAEAAKEEQNASAPKEQAIPVPKPALRRSNTEDQNWRLARNSRSKSTVREFLGIYPNTRHRGQALLLLAELEAEENWEPIRLSNSQSDLLAFLQRFPNTPQARLAQIRLNKLRAEAEDN